MAYDLRNYQQDGITKIRDAFNRVNKVLYQCPTGGGKTVIFSHIVGGIERAKRSVSIIVHRRELVNQCSMSLAENGLEHRIIAPAGVIRETQRDHLAAFGQGYINPATDVVVSSVQTLVKNFGKLPNPDYLIFDEAHHVTTSSTWGKVMGRYPKARALGVTATPERLDGKGLENSFDELVKGPSVQSLIDQNYLCVPKCYSHPPDVDDRDLRTQFGDYNKKDNEEAMSRKKVVGDAVQHYGDLCQGVPAIAFCVTVRHAELVAEKFCAAGFKAVALDGKTDPGVRKASLRALGRGELDLITSCELISEGTDIPLAAAAIMLRKTQSLSLYLQQAGRTLRRYPINAPIMQRPNMQKLISGDTHYAYILDHAGNIMRHGLPQADRNWILTKDKVKRPKRADGLHECPECEYTHPIGPNSCPQCGFSYVNPNKRNQLKLSSELPLEVNGTLVEIMDTPHWAQGLSLRKAPLNKLKSLAHAKSHFEEIQVARGYKRGWVHFAMKERYDGGNK